MAQKEGFEGTAFSQTGSQCGDNYSQRRHRGIEYSMTILLNDCVGRFDRPRNGYASIAIMITKSPSMLRRALGLQK